MSLKNKILLLSVQTFQKRRDVPYMEMSQDNDRQKKESPYMELSRDKDQKRCVYKQRKVAPKSFFKFHSLK